MKYIMMIMLVVVMIVFVVSVDGVQQKKSPKLHIKPPKHADIGDVVGDYVGNRNDLMIFGSACSQMVYKHSIDCVSLTGDKRGQCWLRKFAGYYSTGGCYATPEQVQMQDTGSNDLRFRAYLQYWHSKGRKPIPRFRGLNENHSQKELIVLTFRGTDGWRNWMTDFHANAKYPDGSTAGMSKTLTNLWRRISNSVKKRLGKPTKKLQTYGMHAGFLNIWDRIKERVIGWLTQYKAKAKKIPVIITGHSLGGAIATICAFKLVEAGHLVQNLVRVVTLESPKVGKSSWVRKWNQMDMSRVMYRIVNGNDIAPSVPPNMQHPTDRPTLHLPCKLGRVKGLGLCHKMKAVNKGFRDHFAGQPSENVPVCKTWDRWLSHVNEHHRLNDGVDKSDDTAKQHVSGGLVSGAQTPQPGSVPAFPDTSALHRTHSTSSHKGSNSHMKPRPPLTSRKNSGYTGNRASGVGGQSPRRHRRRSSSRTSGRQSTTGRRHRSSSRSSGTNKKRG